MRLHLCRDPQDCDFCQRRAEIEHDHDDWSPSELDDMADYAAARDVGGGHP